MWHLIDNANLAKLSFQSTHLREVWLVIGSHTGWYDRVSIHTPTRGVTTGFSRALSITWFQSTHLREVWLREHHAKALNALFQSTHLREVWQPLAPSASKIASFNPHTYERCDFPEDVIPNISAWFQSTHLREVWPSLIAVSIPVTCFNPHTYERCDTSATGKPVAISSFNPHTYERCDYILPHTFLIWYVSIHTPTRGVTYIQY